MNDGRILERFGFLAQAYIAVALSLLCGCATMPQLDTADPAAEIYRFYVDEVGDPSCSVALVHGDSVSFAGDPRTIYRIGSLTKLFVAEAVDRLALRGEIDLEAPVTRCSHYKLAPEYESVTLRDLMTHRSGLPMDFLNPWNPFAWHVALMSGLVGSHLYAAFDARADFEREINSSRTLDFLSERSPRYSNIGFALFVTAVEDATGRSVDDLLSEEVTKPMGLLDTTWALSDDQKRRLAIPCAGKLPWLIRRGCPVEAHKLGPALAGMGDLYSSAADCAAFFARIDLTKSGRLRAHRLPSGRWIDYRFGMIYGGASFLCRDRETGDILLILRNVTSWPASEDIELADRLFSRR